MKATQLPQVMALVTQRQKLQEMADAFDISRVNPNPARFDLKKCTAINGDWIRALEVTDLASRMIPFLQRDGVLLSEVDDDQFALLVAATPLVQERLETLGQASGMLGFLFAGATMGQLLSVPMILVGLYLMLRSRVRAA